MSADTAALTRAEVVAAATGDEEALAALVRLYHDRVYRFGVRVCRDEFDADDAVQEAFIKLAARPDIQAQPGAISWLFTVVAHTCRRLLRPLARQRRALGERVESEAVATEELSAEAALGRWELVHAVHAAIARLAPPYREVLVLRELEGLSGEATAALLGLELAAMKTRLHRARAMLREEIRRGASR